VIACAQNEHKIDSLLKVYNSPAAADSNKVKALNSLFTEYRAVDEEKAISYVNQSIAFAAKTDYTLGYALALYNKGQFEGRHGNFDTSDYYISKAIVEYKKITNLKGLGACYKSYGLNMFDKGNNKEALAYFLESLSFFEKANDQKAISGSYTWIGNVYNSGLQQPLEALKYYEKAFKIQKESNDEQGLAFSYNNIGNVNFFLKKYEIALQNYLLSAELKEKLNDQKGLSSCYNNIGSAYASLKNFDKAVEYFNKSLAIYTEFNDRSGQISSYINIGNIYYDQYKYKEAIDILLKALAGSKEIGYKEGIREAAYALSSSYEEMHDAAKALEYYKLSTSTNDSITNTDFNNQIAEMQTKYDVEKKDLELVKNKAELEAKEKQAFIKNIIIGSIVLLTILLAVVGLLFYRKKQVERKAELDAEIAAQKEIRTKAILEAEEKERRRIAQDLHDGVGQLLSAAKLNLSNLDSKFPEKNTDQETAMHNALSLLDDSVKEVRAVSHNMMPNTLIKLGLASAIREFITKLGNAPTLKVDLEIVGLDNRLDNQVETVLYRVIQEIVNNIIKHAKASHISMQLVRHETELNVMIEDNGVGFDTSNIDDFEGLGLKGIRTRIELLNGSVHFDSAIGRGTTVIIDVPVSPA
jgi:two-component system NarL family sensor kinase